jgi:hypothetical protein
METVRPWRGSPALELDLLAPNVLADYVRRAYPANPDSGPAPTLFFSGDRPPFLVTGEDPGILRRIRFDLRHSAALTDSRALLLQMVEASTPSAPIDPESLQTPEGRLAYSDYRDRIFTWATVGPTTSTSFTDDDLTKLFGAQT